MADISVISRLVGKLQRNVSLESNTLVVGNLKIGGSTNYATFVVSAVSGEKTITMPDANVDLGDIATNTSNISTNASNISTNTSDISTLDGTVSGHLDGGTGKHDANEIDFEYADGSKKNIDAASDDVEAALQDLDTAIGALAASPSNYTPSDATIVADHLSAIDSALATAGGTDFADNTFRISDDIDDTKKIAFQASVITTDTVRTITMPDSNVNLGDIASNASSISTNSSAITNLQGAVGAANEAAITYSSTNYVTSGEDTVTAIGDLDAQVGTNASGISTNAGNISTNTGNISTNTGNISTNTSNISTNAGDIDDLEAALGSSTGLAGMDYTSTNYVTVDTTAIAAISALDGQVKTNADAIATLVGSGMDFQGGLDASSLGSQLDDASKGDFFVVTAAGTIFGTNPIELAVGDNLIAKVNISGTPDDGNDWVKIDNTEASDILRTSDLGSTVAQESDMTAAEGDIDDLEAALGSSTGLAGMDYTSTNYVTVDTTVIAAISALDSQVGTNASGISTNAGNISTNSSAISTAEGDIDDLEAALGSSTGLAGMDYTSTNYVTVDTTVIAAISALDSQVGTNASGISTNAGNISTNTGNISTNTSNISTNAGDIDDLEAALGSSTGLAGMDYTSTNYVTVDTTVIAAISALDSQVGTNASGISTNAGNISTNTSNISANTTDVGNLQTLSGRADGSTDLGDNFDNILASSETILSALQKLEDAIEGPQFEYMVAGEAMAANTSFFVRMALNGETAGRVYKASSNAGASGSETNQIYVIGLAQNDTASEIAAGSLIKVIKRGEAVMQSSDPSYTATQDEGLPVYLDSTSANGLFTLTGNSTSNHVVMVVGSVRNVGGSSAIEVGPFHMVGINQ